MNYYSLKTLRTEISIELRNEEGSDARYTTEEMDIAIRRASAILAEYFWLTDVDSSKTFSEDTYNYTYDYPVRDFEKVAFVSNTGPLQYAEDWVEQEDGVLTFLREHVQGETIKVWYALHPEAYPSDLVLSGAHAADVLTLTIDGSTPVYLWPQTGWLQVDNEVMEYTANSSADNTLTVVRGGYHSKASSHATNSAVSFVNRVDKPIFFEGVKDLAIAYLNRMRIVDAPSAQVDGHVTVMREILEGQRQWIRTHRMRTQRQPVALAQSARPNRGRRRGR